MAHPKRRHSNTRSQKRRTHDRHKLTTRVITLYDCPKCGAQKLPHRVCANCGYYGKRKILDVT